VRSPACREKSRVRGVPRLVLAGVLSAMLVAIAPSALGAGDEQDAREGASAFYALYLRLHPSGVPTRKQQTQLRRVVSRRLAALLERAGAAERRYARETKGEVPPLVEGDLFTSLFEGASAFEVGSCESRAKTVTCLVDLGYTDPQDKSSVQWKDRAFLVRDQGGWTVDDIEYLGDWEFMHKGRLQEILKDVIAEGNAAQKE
jgi:hypothetical protein